MRNAHGYVTITGDGPLYGDTRPEMDTFRCNHCGKHTRVHANTRPEDSTKGSKCWQCDSLICDKCAKRLMGTLRCEPFEKIMNRMEGRKEYDRIFAMNKSTL
jgi:hypothetical protein